MSLLHQPTSGARRPRPREPGHAQGCDGFLYAHVEHLPEGRWRVVQRCGCRRELHACRPDYPTLAKAEQRLRRLEAQ